MKLLDLDANATVPLLDEARAAITAALDLANPSSPHARGRSARRVLDEARDHVATALGGRSKDVIFFSGASEANRWLADASQHLRTWWSTLEHPSLAKPLSSREKVDLGDAEIIFCTAAHNETGIVPELPLQTHAILCVDAAQAVARLPPLPERVDAIVCSAHKIGGPAGAGALLLRGRAREKLRAPWSGGGQEGGLRAGTEALALHAGFGAAAAAIERTRAEHAALAPLRDRLESTLVEAWGATAIGADRARLPNTSALTVHDVDGDALRIALDATGVCVGFGAACSALAPEPSPALMSLGLTPRQARATVRLSLPPRITSSEIDEAIERIRDIPNRLRHR